MLLFCFLCVSLQLGKSFNQVSFRYKRNLVPLFSDSTDSDAQIPSDTWEESFNTDKNTRTEDLKSEMLQLISSSDRGQSADMFLNERISSLITELEGLNPTSSLFESSLLQGDWNLLYANDDLTRSSPFFWAFKKALKGIDDPLQSKALADSIFSFTDMDFLGLKSIGDCIQSFESESLVSKVRIMINPVGSSLMTTTSSYEMIPDDGLLVKLTVEKTEVKDSTIASLLPSFLDASKFLSFPSGTALEAVRADSSVVYMRMSYLDDSLRIVKNEEDDKTFVFSRMS